MGHLCCVCIISSAEIKQGRRPDALPMKDATSSGSQPCGCRAPGCAVARVCVPGSFSGLHWSSDFPSGGSVVRRAAVLGAPSSAAGTQQTLLSVLAEARGPWVSSAVSAGVSPVAAGGGCWRRLSHFSSQGLISPQGPAWHVGHVGGSSCEVQQPPFSSLGTLVAAPP